MKQVKTLPSLALLALALTLAGCATLFTSVVTITSVVDAGMKDWATLSVAGKTTPAIDSAVTAYHAKYQKACGIAQDALIAYKANGDKAAYVQALMAVRSLASDIIDAITPLLTSTEANNLKAKLAKATVI